MFKTTPEVGGMGHSLKRKEDSRFIQGKGNYVDDVNLPGMVYGQMVRSPFAHARIKSIDTSKAKALPGVLAVITGEDLAKANLAWMPTLSGDKQMVLATGKVLFQAQEVAFVVAEDRYTAADAAELVEVDYEELPVLVDPKKAMDPGAPLLREDREQKDNHIFHWEVGDKQDTDKLFAAAPVKAKVNAFFQRCHPAPLETCGCVADFNSATGKLTVYLTSQAPHAHRTLFALVGGIPEQNIRVVSPDIGGGFGNKVPIYPGYVCAVVASLTTGLPVKWIETRSENLMSTGFARDYHMQAEIAADKDGTMKALRVKTLADHGAFNAAAQPTKFPAGLFSICTGNYDLKNAFCEVDGVYTNKAPGGIAYRCSFRVTEAAYLIERAVDVLAQELKMDPVELRRKNFITADKFPYKSPLGWNYDSGNYEGNLKLALEKIGYDALRKEQEEKRKKGELMGIGISTFVEIVGAGPAHTFDIAGIKMFDSAEIRIHPTGKAICRMGTKSQGQGHETTYAQIVAQELGIPAADVMVEEGDTDTAPYGLGTYASRSTPVSGAATAMAARKIRDKARKIAAYLLECSEQDLDWEPGKFFVKGSPTKAKTIQEIAFAAYTNHPPDVEAGLEAVDYYNPPNLTFPFGTYICVVDIDKGTRSITTRTATCRAGRSWIICCQQLWRRRTGRRTKRSRPHRTIRSARKESVSRRTWARRRRS
jgi:carbon-monoxide dehydrogenase large subunit